MPAEERRELILAAATRVFATGGYAGTSTDHVAKEAGVSQPYVVRMFGTKLDLFLQVLSRACTSIDDAFAAVIASEEFDPETGDVQLGTAYTDLLADSDLLRVMMHGFATGGVPEIAATARAGMSRIYDTLQRTGWDQEKVRDFLAVGMLLNVLLSMGAFSPDGKTDGLGGLIDSCLPEELIARVEGE
jgi:AcrR family transcriptional regulator